LLRKTPTALIARNASVLAACSGLFLLLVPSAAEAQGLSFKLEPGVAIPMNAPQSKVFGVGGGESLKLLFGLTPYLDIGPSASFVMLPNQTKNAESGVVWALGGGLRLKRPHDARSYYGISPWVDVGALYIRTGELNRPGFDVGVGLAVPVGQARALWVGPFARFLQTAQIDRAGFDNRDARILSLGVSVEFGSGVEPKREPMRVVQSSPEPRIVTNEVVSCPDRDGDGIPDKADHCPEVVGPADNWGCPNYQKVVVKKTKLELKEKIYFAWNQDKLEDASFPVLDEVVQALKDNKNFKVQVEGHADSSGNDDHNQPLSERRAQAVLDYLVSHGVAKERLVSKGFSSSIPTGDNKTVSGREDNRRVDFVVSFIILNDGDAK